MSAQRVTVLVGAAALATALGVAVSGPVSAAGAEIIYPPKCGWTPGHFPGVEQEVIASYCKVVLSPDGGFHAVLRGRLPDGTSVARTYVEHIPGCISLVTVSGRLVNVIAHC